jgi:phage shock protein A
MAREALERSLSHVQMGRNFVQQLEDQRAEAEGLRSAFLKLQQKLTETRAHCDLLIAEHRRARTVGRSQQAQAAARAERNAASIDKYKSRINVQQAVNQAGRELTAGDSLEDRFAMLERDQQVEALLEELKKHKELTA